MSCCCGTKRVPWYRRLWEMMFGTEQSNEQRAVKYFRAQLCGLDAHHMVPGPAANVKRCCWCGVLVEAKPPFKAFSEGMHREEWCREIGAAITGESRIVTHMDFVNADEPPAKLNIRKGRPASIGPAAVIKSLRGWKMHKPDADRIWEELAKRAPEGWAPPKRKAKPKKR